MSSQEKIIYVFFGLVASGKSTLAAAFARARGLPYHNSDALRKELAGVDARSRQAAGFEAGIYSREFSKKTYDALLQAAAADLQQGESPVLDASYGKADERRRLMTLAADEKASVFFVFCHCSERETERRLTERALDPTAVSDAGLEIYRRQKERFDYPDELPAAILRSIDTEADVPQLLKRLEEMLHIG